MNQKIIRPLFTGYLFFFIGISVNILHGVTFTVRTGENNPFNGVDVGWYSVPDFVDINNDGDFDAFIGEYNGVIYYYENTGSAASPTFTVRTGGDNPFNGVDVGSESKPTFVDIDNDGDFDAFIGEVYGNINYYENTGSAASPTFTVRTGGDNPLDGVDVGWYSAPDFVDIDNDGDFDVFIGEVYGTIKYYENTGSAGSPTFTERTGAANPFNGVNVGTHESKPAFVDIDNDGDFDAFIGEEDGVIYYYENTGSASSPTFTERTGGNNPFDGVDVGSYSKPTFVDIDNDGDFDAFIGEEDGVIYYYENTTSVSVTFTNGANAALNYQQASPSPPQNNWHFGQFSLAGNATGAGINSVVVTLGGTYSSGDLGSNPFRLYASNTNDFETASAIGSDIADPGSGNDVTFSSLSDGIPLGIPRYYWVTADISGTATGDDNINGTIDASGDLSIIGGTLSGSSNYGKLNAGSDVSLPVELNAFTARVERSGVVVLEWVTESEIENLGFILERRSNGEWKEIASYITHPELQGQGSVTYRTEYSYTDNTVEIGKTYDYRLADVSYEGVKEYHSMTVLGVTVTETIPDKFTLYPAYPNPFNPETTISFDLPEVQQVTVAIYDLNGREVATLTNKEYSAGLHSVVWDAGDYSSGIYLYRLSAGSFASTGKLVLLK